ncbi:MAG: TonB-dependent receptor [Fidelibacterota bacterium]|nr:MAG: TonB-dependent receptor [Candidatus Neomarinimicrobiota bacterium]
MNIHLRKLFSHTLVPVLFLVSASILFADSSGKISGRVYDAETNEPLPGANVVIEGTTMGAAADIDGNYFILNVRPGEYTVTASVIGYVNVRATEVAVQMGLTTPLDFPLDPSIIEGEEVVVVAERPIIQTDIGNSRTILDGSELTALPVVSFKDILDKQMGIQEMDARGLFMRGERQDGISMVVDGMETRDNVDDLVYTRFNPDEMEQVEISAGGYDASSGNATAGVINLVTKEGGNRLTGTFDYRLSQPGRKHFGPPLKDYWDEHILEAWSNDSIPYKWTRPGPDGNPVTVDTVVNTWSKKAHTVSQGSPYYDHPGLMQEVYRHFMRDEATEYGQNSDMVLSATLGGPVLKNTTFFSSFRREKNYYLYPGPLDHYSDQNGMIKITTKPTKSIKMSLTARYTESTGLNRYDYYRGESQRGDLGATDPDYQTEKRYMFEGVEQVAWSGYGAWPYTANIGQCTRYRNQYGFTLSHQLSPRTFYELKILRNLVETEGSQTALRDTTLEVTLTDPNDPTATVTLKGPLAEAPLGFWETTVANILEWPMGGSYGYEENNSAKDLTIRANITSQVNDHNQLNFGIEYVSYEIKKEEYRNTLDRMGKWLWDVKPRNAAVWLIDNLTFEGAVINASVRANIRIPDEWHNWKSNPYHPVWAWTGTVPGDSAGIEDWYQPPLKVAVAPRLSISHPIGETAKIFFNWGHYYQEQPFERQYLYYRRDALYQQQYGDPELPFKKAIQYEIGYEHNIANVVRVALSGFYKDVKNLLVDRIGFREIGYTAEYANLYTYGPNRYMTSQGLEARLEKRQGRYMTAWFNYSLQIYSRGIYGFTTFYEDSTRSPAEFDYVEENVERPSESRFNLGIDFHTPAGFGPGLLGFHPAGDIDLNFLLWWRQQPTDSYNPSQAEPPYEPRNNVRWKPHWAINMTFKKRFDFGRYVVPVFYVEVYNLLNTKNMWRGAFNEKDAAFLAYIEALEEEGGQLGENEDLAREAIGNNPAILLPFNGSPWFLYLNPRQIWAGIRFEFR